LQPDNFVQDPSNTQNYNRYGYCYNNPLKYTDVTGEWFGWDDLAVAFVGGVINWGANGFQFNAAGLGYFVTGTAAGIATYYGGPVAGAAVLGIGNSVTNQLSTTGKVDGWQIFGDTLTTIAISGASAGIGKYIAPYLDPVVNSIVVNSVIRETVKQSVSNAISGFAIGGAMEFARGGTLNDALNGGLSGLKSGAALGAANGLILGYVAVKAKTVASKENTTQTQTEPTTEKSTATKEGTNGLSKTISVQKQARHIAGTAKPGGGFLNSMDDAQSVLDAVHSGKATFLGTSKAGHQIYRFNGVTGTNVNVGAGITGQPTNVFMIKGTTSPSVVPTSPLWKP
jgi:hypothetical protein